MPVDKSPDPEREAIREKFREIGFYRMPDRETEFLGMFREAVSRHLGRTVEMSEVMTIIADIAGVMAGYRRIVKYNVCYRYQGDKMHAGQYATEPEARDRARATRLSHNSVWIEPVIVCEGLPEFQPDDADDNDDEVTAAINKHDLALDNDEQCDKPEECAQNACPEHPRHNGPDHTWEQHHSPQDHVGSGACRCSARY